jgi:hypothetical protein
MEDLVLSEEMGICNLPVQFIAETLLGVLYKCTTTPPHSHCLRICLFTSNSAGHGSNTKKAVSKMWQELNQKWMILSVVI